MTSTPSALRFSTAFLYICARTFLDFSEPAQTSLSQSLKVLQWASLPSSVTMPQSKVQFTTTLYHPPHRTGQTHLQPLSNQVDCYKAAGMKADVASGPDRRTELGSLSVASQSYVGSSSWHCSLSGGIVLLVAPSVEG
ncbi:unnamed protein product [Arctogadus glacialis]